MEIDRKELKRLARERMKLTRPKFWQVTLVYLLMTALLPPLLDLIPFPSDTAGGINTSRLFLSILLILFTTVVSFGYRLWSLWAFRQLNPGMYSLVQGFSVAGRVIMLEAGIYLRTMGWIFLLSFAVSFSLLFVLPAAPFLLPMVSYLISIAVWIIQLRYALAYYLLADRPDDGAGPAIRRSVELMQGWKWELFKLNLSFLGWELLSVLPAMAAAAAYLGAQGLFSAALALDMTAVEEIILSASVDPVFALLGTLASLPLMLWLQPYIDVTRAGFYDARLELYRSNAGQDVPFS